ncbi:MAG: DUF4105 domain-containing protein [Dehalococcoidia bacterium]
MAALAPDGASGLVAQEISERHAWQGLLHFDRGGTLRARRSAVTSPAFFLAEGGSRDPALELAATLEALSRSGDSASEGGHAQCRFPARALWLEREGLYRWRDDVDCPEWSAWEETHGRSDLGLLFATGYLGNPASFFGHLLFHLSDSGDGGNTSAALLETSYNFGADVPDGEGMIPYVLKGLIGGYEAQFSNAQFFRNAWMYSERQMRDLWYYRLELPEFERRLLVAHLFELEGFRFDYLFLTENCASRIGRTLEIVTDEQIVPSHAPWVSPEAIVRAVTQATLNGEPLLARVEYRPSRRRRTEALYAALPQSAKEAVQSLWPDVGRVDFEAENYRMLEPKVRARVIETALSHVRSLEASSHEDGLHLVERELLRERLDLPAGIGPAPEPQGAPIHTARPGARLSVGSVRSPVHGDGGYIAIRALQYDLLDSDDSRQPNAALELLRVEADLHGGSWSFSSLVLFDVLNLHVDPVPLPLSSSAAWRAKAGVSRVGGHCRSCRDGYLTALVGRAVKLPFGVAYGMGGLTLRTTRHQEGWAAGSVEAGFLANLGRGHRLHLGGRFHDALQGRAGRRSETSAEVRLALAERFDLRGGVALSSEQPGNQLFLALGWYR